MTAVCASAQNLPMVSDQAKAEIVRVFGDAIGNALMRKVLSSVFSAGPDSADRVVMAILLGSGGDKNKFEKLVELSETDWRDTLVGAGLAGENWREILQAKGFWSPP